MDWLTLGVKSVLVEIASKYAYTRIHLALRVLEIITLNVQAIG